MTEYRRKKKKEIEKYYIDTYGDESWYDEKGNEVHFKSQQGGEYWCNYNENGKLIHYKNSDGYEYWKDYDRNGNLIHYKNSYGDESWYDYNGNKIPKEKFDELYEEVKEGENAK